MMYLLIYVKWLNSNKIKQPISVKYLNLPNILKPSLFDLIMFAFITMLE